MGREKRFYRTGEMSFGCSFGVPSPPRGCREGGGRERIEPRPDPRAEQREWDRDGVGSSCPAVKGSLESPVLPQVPPTVSPGSSHARDGSNRQPSSGPTIPGATAPGPEPSLYGIGGREQFPKGKAGGRGRDGGGGGTTVSPQPGAEAPSRGWRAAGVRVAPSVSFHGGQGWVMGKGMSGPGRAGGGSSSSSPRCRRA